MRTHLLYLLVLALSTSAMIYSYGRIDDTSPQFVTWDLHEYQKMAAAAPHLSAEVRQPFAYRILGPYAVGLAPLANQTSFYLFAIVASYVLVGSFYGFLSFAGLSPPMAAAAAFLLTTNKYFFGLTVWDSFQLDDLLCQILLVAMLWAMLANRWVLFGTALFLGALTRETALLMIPTAVVYLLEKKRWQADGLRFSLSALPAIAALVLLRAFIPATGGETLLFALQNNAGKLFAPEALYRLLVNAFIPLTLLPLVFFDVTWQFFRERKYALAFVALVLLSTCFANNHERLMAPTFVIFFWLIGAIFQRYRWGWISVLLVILGCVVSSLHHSIARFPLPNKQWTVAISIGTLLAVTAVGIVVRFRGGERAPSA